MLSNGRKIVLSTVTATDEQTGETIIYPGGDLQQIIAWMPSWLTGPAQVKFAASGKNGIAVTPAATIAGLTFQILAVGV